MKTVIELRRRLDQFVVEVTEPITSRDSGTRTPANQRLRSRAESVGFMRENFTMDDFNGVAYIMGLVDGGRMTKEVAGTVITAIASHVDSPYRAKWPEE